MLKLIGIPVTAFIVCALIGPVLIPYLHKLKFGQSIRECGPASHMAKSGTPTMGGLMMLAALLVAVGQLYSPCNYCSGADSRPCGHRLYR